jgi:membrane-associated phospholipid phosphatase
MESIWNLEIILIAGLQSIFSGSMELMRSITSLGSEMFFILWLPVILWCIDYGLGIKIGLILISSGQIFSSLKISLHSPRPFWYSPSVQAHSIETGYGMPSGHATNTMSIFGLSAFEIKQKWLTWVCGILIFLVGLSRVVLGMHFISDVLTGWLLGALLVWAFSRYAQPFTIWIQKLAPARQYLFVIASTLVWILICLIPSILASGVPVPANWIENALAFGPQARPHPYELSWIFSNAGIWGGVTIGAVWLNQRGGILVKGVLHQQAIKLAIGILGVLILWVGLDKAFPDGQSILAFTLRFVRYCIVGFWVSGAAPEIFIRLKLAKRKEV